MSTRRVGTCVTFVCDECGDELETRETNFPDAWREARGSRWQYPGDRTHQCVGCSSGRTITGGAPEWLLKRGRGR